MQAQAQVLLLNADYAPIRVIPWERAIGLIHRERAELVVGYARSMLHSIGKAMPWPAVVRLVRYVSARARVRFNRSNVLARDSYTCQFCGAQPRKNNRPDLAELTLDHVIPRAQSKPGPDGPVVTLASGKVIPVTCWLNVVAACYSCNSLKADRTPRQAGLKLQALPRAPTAADVLRMSMTRYTVPSEWVDFLPEGASEWGRYWTEELAAD